MEDGNDNRGSAPIYIDDGILLGKYLSLEMEISSILSLLFLPLKFLSPGTLRRRSTTTRVTTFLYTYVLPFFLLRRSSTAKL